mgnify:CR=1 FL=1
MEKIRDGGLTFIRPIFSNTFPILKKIVFNFVTSTLSHHIRMTAVGQTGQILLLDSDSEDEDCAILGLD